MLLNFTELLTRQSIGTWTEYGWAWILNKPVVIVSQLPEILEHPFVWKRAARLCDDMDSAINYLVYLLK
jgi:hypothetical protein